MAADDLEVVDLTQAAASEAGGVGGIVWSARTDDLNLNVVVLGPNHPIPEHLNAQLDVVLIGVEGTGRVEVEGRHYRLPAGQAMVIPKGTTRAISAESERFAYLSCHRRRPALVPEPAVRGPGRSTQRAHGPPGNPQSPDMTGQPAVPSAVARAVAAAQRLGFDRSCSIQTGRLLAVLTAQARSGVIGEIGSGCGVGTAWLASGLAGDASLVTVELDGELARATTQLFERTPAVRVIHGDWRDILPHGPFALLFADAGAAKREGEVLLAAIIPGGLIVLDDLTPGGIGGPDPVRDFWLGDSRVVGTEVQVSAREAVILATRVG